LAKKLHALTVRGRTGIWKFPVYLDAQYLEEWRADGLEIDEISNTVPAWIAGLGLTRAWCFIQDVFQFKNPFSR
jgi:hypothetical protein